MKLRQIDEMMPNKMWCDTYSVFLLLLKIHETLPNKMLYGTYSVFLPLLPVDCAWDGTIYVSKEKSSLPNPDRGIEFWVDPPPNGSLYLYICPIHFHTGGMEEVVTKWGVQNLVFGPRADFFFCDPCHVPLQASATLLAMPWFQQHLKIKSFCKI